MTNKTPRQFETLPLDAMVSSRKKRRTARTEVSAQDGQPAEAGQAPLPGGNELREPSVIIQSGPSGFPPPSRDLDEARPPRGRRTPARPLMAPDFGADLPRNAPGWMRRARRMTLALEAAISRGVIPDTTEACIERAWAAWELGGSSDREIAKVAHLVQRAHRAIRNTGRAELAEAVNDCAEVLWTALPQHVLKSASFEQVVDLVRGLKAEADPWTATLTATSELLGWGEAGRAHAAHAIRIALVDFPPSTSTPEPEPA